MSWRALVLLHPFEVDCAHRVNCALCFRVMDKGFVTFTVRGCTSESKAGIGHNAAWGLLAPFLSGFWLWRWTFLSGMSCHTQCSLTGWEMILGNKYFHFKSHLSAKAPVGNSFACKSDKSNLTCAPQYWENICDARLILDIAVAM